MGSDCKFCSLTFRSCGLCVFVLVRFTRGVFWCRLRFDEFRPELEDVLDEIQREFAAKAKTPAA